MDEVADKTGIAKGTIYRYFPTKDKLFVELSMRYMEMLGNEATLIAGGEGEPLERLRLTLKKLAELVNEHNDFFQVMMRHECEVLAHPQFNDRRSVIRHSLVMSLKQAQARKEIACPYSLETAADMLLGMMRSLNRFTAPKPKPEQIADMIMFMFLKGMGTERSASAAPAGGKNRGAA